MGRTLSVGDYGIFASLISLFNIFSVFAVAIMMVFAKFSASLVGQKKEKLIGSLVIAGNIWVGLISLFICGLLVVFSYQISDFLHINSQSFIVLTVVSLFFSFLTSVPQGVLQGLLQFGYFSFVSILASFIKLTFGILLVAIGLKALGAIYAFLLANIAGYLFSFLPLLKHLKVKALGDKFTLGSLHSRAYSYAMPVFLSNIGIISLVSLDIILVKHYFNPTLAGQYAALSLMGRAIFYVVSPIASVLFPIIVQKKERQERLTGTLLLSIALIMLPSIVLSFMYFFFPKMILGIFFPNSIYLSLTPYLGPFSVFILIYSMCYLLNSFYLSIGKTKVFIFTIVGVILESLSIVFFHENINQVIIGLIVVSFLLLFSLLIYYRNATKAS
ncbi:MAG: oligosaccharide flippase family protein [Candidatus Levybacteria bacterium]|nr:oligosaccharide flippase family protein [Candidatus Levybacteria bacterium]